ncbi:CALS7, partial [Symbiodinium sp. CCMP2456]
LSACYNLASSLLACSPIFSAFQSKLMAHFFETTLNYGGAQYIPTGRGLATQREPFVKNFRCFAPTHLYDAMEVIVLLVFSAGVDYGAGFYLCTSFSSAAWVVSPLLFNPRQFESKSQALRDISEWMLWMTNSEPKEEASWCAWQISLQEEAWWDLINPDSKFDELIERLAPGAFDRALGLQNGLCVDFCQCDYQSWEKIVAKGQAMSIKERRKAKIRLKSLEGTANIYRYDVLEPAFVHRIHKGCLYIMMPMKEPTAHAEVFEQIAELTDSCSPFLAEEVVTLDTPETALAEAYGRTMAQEIAAAGTPGTPGYMAE